MQKVNLQNRDSVFYEFDPVTGFWGIPNIMQRVHFTGDRPVDYLVKHNKSGIRDKDYVMSELNNTIVCLGGSNTWGSAVEQNERYSNLLEQYTNQTCVNMGHNSFGLDQICLTLLTKTEQFSPGIVIIEQYPWALHRVLNSFVNGYIKPNFYLTDQGKLELTRVPFWARFAWYRSIVGVYRTYLKEFREYKAGIDITSEYDVATDPIFLYWKLNYYSYMYQLTEKILRVIYEYAHNKNLKLMFIILPVLQQFIPTRSELVDYDLPQERLIELLRKIRIHYIDMVPQIKQLHNDRKPLIQFDGHLTASGHELIAQEINKELKRRRWL